MSSFFFPCNLGQLEENQDISLKHTHSRYLWRCVRPPRHSPLPRLFRCQPPIQAVTRAPAWPAAERRFPRHSSPSSRSIRLLERLGELGEACHLLGLQLITGAVTEGPLDGDADAQGRSGDGVRGLHALPWLSALLKPPRVCQPGSSPNPVLLGFCGSLMTGTID